MKGTGAASAPRAPTTAKLGIAFVLAGLGFGLTAALVCGIALLGLTIGAVAWVELATLRGRLERLPGPTRRRAHRSPARAQRPGRPALVAEPRSRGLAIPARPGPARSGEPRGSRPARPLAAPAGLAAIARSRRTAAGRSGALGRSRLSATRTLGGRRPRERGHLESRRPRAAGGRRAAALPPGKPGLAHPLAGGRAHRGDDRAAAGRRRRAAALGRLRSARGRRARAARARDAGSSFALRRARPRRRLRPPAARR